MGLHDGITIYKLKKSFTYHSGGNIETCTEVLLREPTSQHTPFYMRMRQMITKASADVLKNMTPVMDALNESEGGQKITALSEKREEEHENEAADSAEFISMAILQADRVDAAEFVNEFAKLVTANSDVSIAACNSKEKLKASDWKKISPEDQFDMAICWCSFFVMPSSEDKKGSVLPFDSAEPQEGA